MLEKLEGLLFGKFSEFPLWVRIITYFTMLALYLYLYLSPRFVNGHLVTLTPSGGLLPYRGVELQTHVEGRVLKFRTDENGLWSIPVVQRVPQSMKINVFHEDEGAWFEVTLKPDEIWKINLLDKEYRIEVAEETPFLKPSLVSRDVDKSQQVADLSEFFSNAEAAELKLPDSFQLQTTPQELEGVVKSEVYSIIGNIADRNNVDADFPFSRRGNLSYVNRIQVIEAIEQRLNIKIPDEHWKRFTRAGEVADYVYKRKVLEIEAPQKYQFDRASDWTQMETTTPRNQIPIFTYDRP